MTTDFSEPWDMSDVRFTVEGRPLYGNKAILSMWSPVLKVLLFGDFKEKNAEEIELPGKNYEDILELFMVIHPPNKDINESNADVILELCREYQIEALTGRCERYLVTIPPSVHWLVVAEMYNLPKLKTYCMEYIDGTRLHELSKQDDFRKILLETKYGFLMKKCNIYEPIIYAIHDIVLGKKSVGFPPACYLTQSHRSESCEKCALYVVRQITPHINKLPK